MTEPARILVVEDQPDWQITFKMILERGGFQATTAATRDEAEKSLETGFFHVVLLDIQLEEVNPDNRDGLDLLRAWHDARLLDTMAVIVTSSHSRANYIRDAFRHASVDYLIKDEIGDGTGLVDKVAEVLRDTVHFNGDLRILWPSDEARGQAVVGLWIRGQRVRRDTAEAGRACDELEDLLRRLFSTSSKLMVEAMRPGLSGSGVLRVRSFHPEHGLAEPVVVKFGDAASIRQEHANYESFVEGFVGGARSTTARRTAFTPALGGIVYSFVGAESDRLEDFGDFYRRSDAGAVCEVLRRLFTGTCARWYGNRGHIEPLDLGADYQALLRFSPENLEQAMAAKLQSVQPGPRLRFTHLGKDLTLRNPIPVVSGRFIRSTATAVTHGDFNEHNILLDGGGDAWLIDFMRTGRGHILRDVAQLDSVVRFQLLAAAEATLDERYELERVLARVGKTGELAELPEAFATGNPALRKAFEVSLCLRNIAARIIEAGGLSDFGEYQLASMFFAVNTIRFYSVPQTQREHALLAGAILAERLVP